MNNKKGVDNLHDEIFLVQLEKFCGDFDGAMKRSVKSDLKKFLAFLAIYGISLTAFLLYPSIPTAIIFIVLSGGKYAYDSFKADMMEMDKVHPKNKNGEFIELVCQGEPSVEEVLSRGVGDRDHSEFFREDYIERLNAFKRSPKTINIDDIKYEKALERQKESKRSIDNADEFDRELAINSIVREIELIHNAYKLPELSISDDEWNEFFNTTYSIFSEKGIRDKYESSMRFVVRMSFAHILLEDVKTLDINTFIRGLDNLLKLENLQFTPKDIASLKDSLCTSLMPSKIIQFTNVKVDKDNG